MNILVTGGNGYKGSVLVPKLIELGHRIISIDLNWFGEYLKPHPNLKIIKEDIRNIEDHHLKNIDAVIHLANIANDPAVELDPRLSWEVNVLASQQLAAKAKKAGVKIFLYASSGSVYGVSDKERVTEDNDLLPISEYNKTKMVAERIFLSYKDDMKVYCIRPATVCGVSPRMRLDVSVNILTYSALKNGVITVFGGKQIRPNIHIDDICNVYIFFLKNFSRIESGTFNAGFENISILDIANMVKEQIPQCEIKVTPSNDPRSYRQCSDKLLSIGFKPSKDVKTAISDIISAYKVSKLNTDSTCFSVKRLKELDIK
ncbi:MULTISPECIES: NAD-dependent epimerase/dehydratase family protein [Prochlorococcus]|uniref:NAD dependent epimerase/dehydratase n=1 Tax=Prochlorococcus marinus (strain SARG / CCMP1375 / SS120) TaxID=167539 RepID=Q7VAY0_PROMA|nr:MULTISPECIES: SDR family oxidoreductase [Prochlorococcus]AAQ00367.1 NAD dependent epimerase/dehydratase [Prochlorococcus marinus subsp. marinus str. CCMP1375]KGG14247.1 UDP-glucose 4-epimerase [Prochlorococcus marinus str. LG]KGG22180.1 UDP-glucose 4-epimerase [Prochlorococcus marinus str. SS2]KGG24502.1 UDP-glucose 4-epimerase [Prochlorococcus marinus str. SS35]KGG33397.1 UDP-glucose 4-epimerase [Prochlorococcus marinus str. SS51]